MCSSQIFTNENLEIIGERCQYWRYRFTGDPKKITEHMANDEFTIKLPGGGGGGKQEFQF